MRYTLPGFIWNVPPKSGPPSYLGARWSRSFWIELAHDDGRYGSFHIYADSENTLAWLEERGLLRFEVHETNGYVG